MDPEARADASVRPARAADAPAIAGVQLQTWRTGYSRILPPAALDAIDPVDAEARWREAVLAPPTAAHAVFVALTDGRLVGLVAAGPGTDEDAGGDGGEILELLVVPGAQRTGHGSRLLTAAVDHLESHGLRRLVSWRFEADEPALTFFRSAGWAEDGSRRTLDMGEPIEQVRLHTEVGISVTPLL